MNGRQLDHGTYGAISQWLPESDILTLEGLSGEIEVGSPESLAYEGRWSMDTVAIDSRSTDLPAPASFAFSAD